MDLALFFAVFRRLTGYPLDALGNPRVNPTTGLPLNLDGKAGLRIPAVLAGSQSANKAIPDRDAPDALRLFGRGYHQKQSVQVPVYAEGSEAKKWRDIFPACSFITSGLDLGQAQVFNSAPGDEIRVQEGPDATITNNVTGYQFSGPDQFYIRKNPDQWDVEYAIKLYATDVVQMVWLERVLLDLFPRYGGILVEQADGSYRTLDFFWERYAVMDQGAAFDPAVGVGAEQTAYIARTMVYRFETNQDNSVNGFGVSDITLQDTILERILEIQNIQGTVRSQRIRLEDLTP